MDVYEKELECYNFDFEKDKRTINSIQNRIEIIIPLIAAVSGLISRDMYVTYNFALFMYFLSTIRLRFNYSKIFDQYFHNKRYYYTFLKNNGVGVEMDIYKMQSIKWNDYIDRWFKFKRKYALILSFIYIITPILLFNINHLISSIINLSALWIFIFSEKRKCKAVKKAYMLGNNMFLKYEQYTKKEKE